MTGALYLAWRYVAANRFKSLVLLVAISLTLYLPLASRWTLVQFRDAWTARADATPLVVGAAGSRFDLSLHALYFRGEPPHRLTMKDADAVRDSGHARSIPLYLAHTASGHPLVGTTLDYLDRRGLVVGDGHAFAQLGDCVVGASVARRLGLRPGDRLLSDPDNLFHLAGAYPLNMLVAGVLAPAGTADDEAVFADLKTAWVVSGIGHGHEDLATTTDRAAILTRRGNEIVGSPEVYEFTTITDANRHTFHFHGDPETFPVTAILAFPHDARAAALLRGRYLATNSPVQIVVPSEVVDEILDLVLRVQRLFDAASAAVAFLTVLFLALVALLSMRLRRREMETLVLVGAGRGTLALMHAGEYVLILLAAAAVAGLAGAATPLVAGQWLADIILGGM